MNLNTSAGRLLNIIEKAPTIPTHTKCIDAWSNILDVKNNTPLLYKRLGMVMTLPLEAKNEILNITDITNKKPYLKWEQKINNAFLNQNLAEQWKTFSQHINQDVIDYLEIATNMIAIKNPEVSLEQEKINKLKQDFLEIEKEIENSDIDLSLKEFIISRTKDIVNSLEEYKIKGMKPLKDALNISIGEIILNKDLSEKSNKNSLSHKFWNLIVSTSVVITIAATDVSQIQNNIQNILPFVKMDNGQQETKSNKKEKIIIDVDTSTSINDTVIT